MYGVRTDENGLYHIRARFYNTEIKRFINQDLLRGELTNTQSLNRYSYVQGNPVSYTDPFGLSPLKKLNDAGHSFLTLVGMECGIIGGIADFINGCWYMAEGNTTMATLSFISGLPAVGNVASGALSVMKCAKAAKIVGTTTKAVSTATTFTMASAGVVSGAKNIYNNVKNGEILSWDNLFEAGAMALNIYTASATGKSMWNFGKSYAGNVAKKWSGVKESGSVKRSGNAQTPLRYDLQFFASTNNNDLRTYYHVTTKERANKIISSGELGVKGNKWESRVFAWTEQPTKKQASIAGIGKNSQTVISFKTNASFEPDIGNRNKSISNIVVQTTDGQRVPISVSNVEFVGFKKEWWQFWKK